MWPQRNAVARSKGVDPFSSRKLKRHGISNAAYVAKLPIGQSATIGHATVRILLCSGESQRTRRSSAKQCHARKMLALTEGCSTVSGGRKARGTEEGGS
eukprot:7383533-Prymnesium_polylepis.2